MTNNLLFSEKPLPKLTLELDGVTIERIAQLPVYMHDILYTTGVGKNKGKQYVYINLKNGVFANRLGALFTTAHMDTPLLLNKVEAGITINAWRFYGIHPSFSAAQRRAEWLKHQQYPWASRVQAVFEYVVAYNDTWDDASSQLEKQWLSLARAAEVAMGKARKFELATYSAPFVMGLVSMYPEEQHQTHVDLARRWLADPAFDASSNLTTVQ